MVRAQSLLTAIDCIRLIPRSGFTKRLRYSLGRSGPGARVCRDQSDMEYLRSGDLDEN